MRYLLVLFLLLTPVQDVQQSVVIPIQNPSFEQGNTGWQWGAGSRIFQPTVANSPSTNPPLPTAPDGSMVALAGYGSIFSQVIALPKQPSGIYTLKFSVANYFYWYPGQYVVSVSLDSFYQKPLCSVSGHALGDFTQITLLCPVRDQVATNLRISFVVNGWSAMFDDVSLTFRPVD